MRGQWWTEPTFSRVELEGTAICFEAKVKVTPPPQKKSDENCPCDMLLDAVIALG